jgi:chromate transporter
VLAQQAVFFSRMAVVTFGGAYAVLTYVAQHAVEVYGWLTPAEMLDGLGLAETTPGPLIQVVQFVGYLAAYRNPAGMDPLVAGVVGSILTTWVTFAPCFFFIFAGAPFLDAVSRWPSAQAALRGITAAVTGVVLNLAVWFSVHTLFAQTRATHAGILDVEWPVWSTIDPGAASIALIATVLTLRFEARMFTVLGFGAGAGILLSLLH